MLVPQIEHMLRSLADRSAFQKPLPVAQRALCKAEDWATFLVTQCLRILWMKTFDCI